MRSQRLTVESKLGFVICQSPDGDECSYSTQGYVTARASQSVQVGRATDDSTGLSAGSEAQDHVCSLIIIILHLKWFLSGVWLYLQLIGSNLLL